MPNLKGLLTLALIALAGCATPVPYEKSDYVGEWASEQTYLEITRDGHVYYQKLHGRFGSTSLDGLLQGFKGDSFAVGFGPFAQTFKVDKPPYWDGDYWRMVVDGVELTRFED